MICGKISKDKINYENIPEMMVVERFEVLERTKIAMAGHVERIDEEKDQVKALHLKVVGLDKGQKKVLLCNIMARGLQKLDAQDRKRC